MENPAANQLPEVDSLPDGFVESSAEPLAPLTPTLEQENPVIDYKEEKLVEPESTQEKPVTDYKEEKLVEPKLVVVDFQSSEGGTEKTEKLRTFPVPLSENDSCGPSQDPIEVVKEGCLEQSEGASVAAELSSAVFVDAIKESAEGVAASAHGEEQLKRACPTSENSIQGGLDPQATHVEGKSSLERIGNNRNNETSEVKRKSTKRTFKSEKEFLEFSLKYQQILAERDAASAVRDKLESLCRELQRQNKMLMDECKRVSAEGQNLRLDLSTKFQDAIKEVSNKLDEQKDESLSQLKENEMLRNKLKQLADQYALSEQQYTQKLKQKALELQLADLRTQQHEQKLMQEQSQMKLYAEQVSQLLATEKNLRLQLTADGEKFQQFQEALLKSHEVFETFKQEIEKMSKSIKELKKENIFLKSKSEKSDVTLIELVEEREHLKKQLGKTRSQKEKLESLCRSLQAERKQNSIGGNSSDSVPA